MLIKAVNGVTPRIDTSARLAENAVVTGNVVLEADVSIWYGAVLRGDAGEIRVGRGSNIQDNVVVHCSAGADTVVGENVVVGHGAILHSCRIGDDCLIGMGAVLLDGCAIGEGSIIGAGALVSPGKAVPPGSLVMGVPGKVVRGVSQEEAQGTRDNAAQYVKEGRELLLPPVG